MRGGSHSANAGDIRALAHGPLVASAEQTRASLPVARGRPGKHERAKEDVTDARSSAPWRYSPRGFVALISFHVRAKMVSRQAKHSYTVGGCHAKRYCVPLHRGQG